MKKKERCLWCLGTWFRGLWSWQCWVDGWTPWSWRPFPALMILWFYCCYLLFVLLDLFLSFFPFQSPPCMPCLSQHSAVLHPQTGEVLSWAPLNLLLLVQMQSCQHGLSELQLTAHQLFWCCVLTKKECTAASPTHSDVITILWCCNCAKCSFPLLQSLFRKHIRCGDGNGCVEALTLLPTFYFPENKDCSDASSYFDNFSLSLKACSPRLYSLVLHFVLAIVPQGRQRKNVKCRWSGQRTNLLFLHKHNRGLCAFWGNINCFWK